MPRAKKAAVSKAKAKTRKPSRRAANVKAVAKPASKRAKPKTAPLPRLSAGLAGSYLGQVALLPYNFTPQGWAPCNGGLLPISQYVPLFQLIGKTYGGNGVTNFALPNLAPRTPYNGPWYYIAIQGVVPPR
jgi:hypothetical protein